MKCADETSGSVAKQKYSLNKRDNPLTPRTI